MKRSLLFLNLILAMAFIAPQAEARHRRHNSSYYPAQDPLVRNDVVNASSPCAPGTPKLYCNMIIRILSDKTSCAGSAVEKAQALARNHELSGMDNACKPFAQLNDPISVFVRLATKLGEFESDWNPRVCGDGGRSCGLLQISRSDGQNPRYTDCQPLLAKRGRKAANIFDPETNLRCGLCEMFADMPVDKAVGEVRAERVATHSRRGTYYRTRYVTLGAAHMYGAFYHSNQQRKKAAIMASTGAYCTFALNNQYRDVASATTGNATN